MHCAVALVGGLSLTGHLQHAVQAPLALLQGGWQRLRSRGAGGAAATRDFEPRQLELLKGNEKLFSARDLVRTRPAPSPISRQC